MVALGWPGNDYNVISFKEFEQSRAKWSDPQKDLAVSMSELSRASGRKKWKFRHATAKLFGIAQHRTRW
jgi:hypothetical protein